MKKLEGLAREMFVKFSMSEFGIQASWDHLSDKRKLAWMEDVITIADYFMLELQKDFKLLPSRNNSATVYESGFMDGVRQERAMNIESVEKVHDTLLEQYADFVEKLNKK